jgi:hypothetical protein
LWLRGKDKGERGRLSVDVIPFSLDKRGPFGLGWKHHPGLKVDANYY